MANEYICKQDAVNTVANTAKIVASFNYQYAIDALSALAPADVTHVIRCRKCKYFWAYRCMDSMPIEMCELGQTFYDPDIDFCSLAESREE